MSSSDNNFPITDLDRLAIDTVRVLSMDAVEQAKSGHPGMPMALAPAAYLLYMRFMQHSPRDPAWPDRDRFILSAGHGSMLLYATLHLCGYNISLAEIKRFRQWQSLTPGHPERIPELATPGVETTTGPLGQGFANGVGMAMAERFLRERYGSDVVDHRTYAICSDGDLMEGISSEAASLAGHLGLGKLVYLYDDNSITIDGKTDLSFSEDVDARFRSYGWHVLSVADVNDLDSLTQAISSACEELERPSLVRVRSVIAYPAPNKQDTPGSHGAPLGEEEVRATKRALGFDPDLKFHVPDGVYAHCRAVVDRGKGCQHAWQERFERFQVAKPELAEEWGLAWSGRLSGSLAEWRPSFDPAKRPRVSTRSASGEALQTISAAVPTMIGGSADLAESVKTRIKDGGVFSAVAAGKNVFWGVREHAMAGAVNGLALHGGMVKPFGSTFLIFSDYMRPSIRLSALMQLPVVWVFSHDSIGVGEDGPTHQPVEQLASLRAIPGLTVIRPGDAAETVEAWRVTVEELNGPVCLVLSRQDLPVLARSNGQLNSAAELTRGGYILRQVERPQLTLVGTGSELYIALEAAELLAQRGIVANTVSLPSFELFAAQDRTYRESVISPDLPSLSVEAGISQGWERWVTHSVSIDRFGASAPGAEVLANYGFTAENVASEAERLL